MRLSTKSRFAVTAMIDLALHQSSGPLPLSSIALRHQISLSYLEQMFSKLRHGGLVESTRGPGGGYMLAQRADSISVASIIAAIEGGEDDVPSHAGQAVRPMGQDMTQDLWDALSRKMVEHLQSITLHSLAVEQRVKGFQLETRKTARQGVLKKPKHAPVKTTAPNSVFALGQSLLARG